MQNIIKIALNNLRIYFSVTGNIISLVVVPVILTIILGIAFSDADESIQQLRIDVVDLDNSDASTAFVSLLKQTATTLFVCPMDNDDENRCRLDDGQISLTVAQSVQRLEDGLVAGVIVIPESYDQVADGTPIVLDYYSRAEFEFGDPVRQSLNAVIQELNAVNVARQTASQVGDRFVGDTSIFTDDDDRRQFLTDVASNATVLLQSQPVTINTMSVSQTEVDLETQNFGRQGFGQSVPGMGSMYVMFIAFAGLTFFVQERKLWTLQRLIVMPLPRYQILGGKILAYVILGMLQYLIVFGVGIAFGTDLGSEPLGLALLMLAYVLCVTALAFALGVFLREEEQISSISLLLTLTLAPLGGAWWPLEITPQFMQIIGHISPIAWAMDGFRTLIFFGGTLADVLLPITVLLVAAIVFFAIGARNFMRE